MSPSKPGSCVVLIVTHQSDPHTSLKQQTCSIRKELKQTQIYSSHSFQPILFTTMFIGNVSKLCSTVLVIPKIVYYRTRSGFLDEDEFGLALQQMDINFSADFLRFLIQRGDSTDNRISLDQFIINCVQIQRFTDEFKARDSDYSGAINLKYEDFLEMILRCL